jgi:hypothetical protein
MLHRVNRLLRKIGTLFSRESASAKRHQLVLRRIGSLEGRVRETEARAERADRLSEQLRIQAKQAPEDLEYLQALPSLLDEVVIGEHVRRTIGAAPLLTSPCDYMVVPSVLPDEIYDLLLRAMPPEVFFDYRDPIKQNVVFPMTIGSALTTRVWNFMDTVIAGRVIREAVTARLREVLQHHFDIIFGTAFRQEAESLPHRTEGGRLMLRRPGYHLRPHRDPKRVLITCLIYLARPGDSEAYGTQLFHVTPAAENRYKQTYYPEADGLACELATTVPFRRNTLLVLLNSRGSHGVTIPVEAPAGLERYAYQFYVAPETRALSALVKRLPPDRRTKWKSRDLPRDWAKGLVR